MLRFAFWAAALALIAPASASAATLEEIKAKGNLEVAVDASRIAALQPGARVQVSIESLGKADVDAVVSEVARAVDPVAHTAIVKVDVPAVEGLRTGMYGRARIPTGTVDALTVPDTAIRKRGQLSMVYVSEKGVARMRLVHTGSRADGRTVVLAGLRPGDLVVVDPPASLGDGTPLGSQAPADRGAR